MLGALAVAILLGNGIGSVGAEQNTGTEGHASEHRFNATEMSRLRKEILGDPLDPYVPPSNGTRVSTQFRLFKVLNVDIASGKLLLKIWRRTVWYDDRLKWNTSDYDGIKDFAAFPLNGREKDPDNNLWLPPMYTTNTIVSEADSTEVGGARVRYDGRVWHSVPGTLELSCRFTNLVNFPRDTLSCPMEVTSWMHADHTVNLSYFDADLEWGWPVHHPAGMIWKEVGPRRPASGSEIIGDAPLVNVLFGKLGELRNRTGKPEMTVSLNYTSVTSEPVELRSYEVRLNSSGLNTTGFPRGVTRGDFIKVNESYFMVVDPLPCAEYGAQSPASGSSYNQFEITNVDCETHSRTFPVKPDEVWTALWMTIHIQRRSTTTCRLACIRWR